MTLQPLGDLRIPAPIVVTDTAGAIPPMVRSPGFEPGIFRFRAERITVLLRSNGVRSGPFRPEWGHGGVGGN